MMMHYEAWDFKNHELIYRGVSRSKLIDEVADYIYNQNHINEYMIDGEGILGLNEKQLKAVGIKLYSNLM